VLAALVLAVVGATRSGSGTDAVAGDGRGPLPQMTLAQAAGQRIVFAYDMAIGGRKLSASLVTVEFEAVDAGARMVYTEQLATAIP